MRYLTKVIRLSFEIYKIPFFDQFRPSFVQQNSSHLLKLTLYFHFFIKRQNFETGFYLLEVVFTGLSRINLVSEARIARNLVGLYSFFG